MKKNMPYKYCYLKESTIKKHIPTWYNNNNVSDVFKRKEYQRPYILDTKYKVVYAMHSCKDETELRKQQDLGNLILSETISIYKNRIFEVLDSEIKKTFDSGKTKTLSKQVLIDFGKNKNWIEEFSGELIEKQQAEILKKIKEKELQLKEAQSISHLPSHFKSMTNLLKTQTFFKDPDKFWISFNSEFKICYDAFTSLKTNFAKHKLDELAISTFTEWSLLEDKVVPFLKFKEWKRYCKNTANNKEKLFKTIGWSFDLLKSAAWDIYELIKDNVEKQEAEFQKFQIELFNKLSFSYNVGKDFINFFYNTIDKHTITVNILFHGHLISKTSQQKHVLIDKLGSGDYEVKITIRNNLTQKEYTQDKRIRII